MKEVKNEELTGQKRIRITQTKKLGCVKRSSEQLIRTNLSSYLPAIQTHPAPAER